MKKIVLIVAAVASVHGVYGAQISRTEYVENWKQTAIEQMVAHNIPASITLAQGILESGSGNSDLAVKGNNHFGIKCHGWTGKKMYMNDDAENECFRMYKDAKESYEDHSTFLKTYSRYAFLFTYDVTDYKSWAKGLKQAGYATNPSYPDLLVKIIEELDLAKYDQNASFPEVKPELIASSESYTNKHVVSIHENKVKYVIAKKGDTFYKISKEFGLNLNQLYRYNDFAEQKDVLEEGDVIYIQPKRHASLFKKKEITLTQDMTIEEIAQKYALNSKSLKRLNHFTEDQKVVAKGEKVTLR